MTADSLALQLTCGEGDLIAGDIGLVVIKALLENGISYIVTGWMDAAGANPLDAAIAGVQHSILASHGVLLRRQRPNSDYLQSLLEAPARARLLDTSAEGAATSRGAVIWSGRHGMTAALERFAQMRVTGGVIGFCFDTDIVRSTDAVVIDPSPTVAGIVGAIDEAFALSYTISRPVLIMLRQRATGMRGTLRCRDNILPHEAQAFADVLTPDSSEFEALERIQPNTIDNPGHSRAIICTAMLGPTVRSCAPADTTVVVALTNVIGEAERDAVRTAESLLVLEHQNRSLARVVAQVAHIEDIERVGVDADSVNRARVIEAINAWVAEDEQEEAEKAFASIDDDRVPRRGLAMQRGLPPEIATGLVLAQAYVGVPVRMHPAFSSYQTETGNCVTVVSAQSFLRAGIAAALPAAQTGVFIVVGAQQSAAVVSAAGSMGATVEAVDQSNPRAIAEAIARACAQPPLQPRIVIPTVVSTPRTVFGEVGVESELVGADRIAFSTIHPAARSMMRSDAVLVGVPQLAVTDRAAAAAGAPVAAEISPAWYDVAVRRNLSPFSLKVQRFTRQLFRALVRMEK